MQYVTAAERRTREYGETGAVTNEQYVVEPNTFKPEDFLSEVPENDASGHPMPQWKRAIIARQLSEKASQEHHEKTKVEEEESRYLEMPAWKRALIEKRKKTESESDSESKPETSDTSTTDTHTEAILTERQAASRSEVVVEQSETAPKSPTMKVEQTTVSRVASANPEPKQSPTTSFVKDPASADNIKKVEDQIAVMQFDEDGLPLPDNQDDLPDDFYS